MRTLETGSIGGVWPVMLTPFTDQGEVDYPALGALVEWYEAAGVDGLFAACLSSEMFHLSLEERVEIVRLIKRNACIPVIASGHVSFGIADQLDELKRIAGAGADAVILVANRLACEGDPPSVWMRNLDYLLRSLDEDVPLGFYECPYPYKRLIGLDELAYCAGTGRFLFLKDTCCDAELIRKRLAVLRGGRMRLFNANAATLLDSLKAGAAGYSGVMANFHPELYGWLLRNWRAEPEKAELLQAFLTLSSKIEQQLYPVNAKAHLQSLGLPVTTYTRSKNHHLMSPLFLAEVEQMNRLARWIFAELRDQNR
jgi:4-hydroxy-tetrahydrodipicolinate synthase